MNHRRFFYCMIAILIVLSALLSVRAQEPVMNIGSRLELFVDHYLIEQMTNTELCMHAPIPAGTALTFDQSWEGRYCGYATVLQDGDLFRLYYRGSPVAGKDGSDTESTCVAESRDGVNWLKPNVGIYEQDGNKTNNIVLKNQAPFSHNFSPFLDHKPDVPSLERYKAVAGTRESGLAGFVSADGLHWRKIQEEPLITQGAFDSQNLVFWSQLEDCYVCYFRTWSSGEFKGFRTISRAVSRDFIHWSTPEAMTFGDTPLEHLYTNQTQPYFRAPHIYMAFPARFLPGRKVLTVEEFQNLGGDKDYASDCSETCFMSSRGGNRYDRTFMEGYIRPGLGLNNWSSRTNYMVCGMIPTATGEISMFIQRNYGQPTHHLERMIVRTDGFVSVNAPYVGGELRTKPLYLGGKELVLNYSTSAAGSIRVEIQDNAGKAIHGFTLDDCNEMIGDRIEGIVRWKGEANVSSLAGRPVHLRFVMKDADLYSVRFR